MKGDPTGPRIVSATEAGWVRRRDLEHDGKQRWERPDGSIAVILYGAGEPRVCVYDIPREV